MKKTQRSFNSTIRKKPRSKAKTLRIYGPPGFHSWVTQQRCIACGFPPYEDHSSHAHHTETGGTRRKADWTTIIPLCCMCHGLLHSKGRIWFEVKFDIDLEDAAIATQQSWRAYTEEGE